jgi:hypothetical protein
VSPLEPQIVSQSVAIALRASTSYVHVHLAGQPAWFASLGATPPKPGDPAVDGTAAVRVGDCETKADRALAYTLISTGSADAAMDLAKGCSGSVALRLADLIVEAVRRSPRS